MRKNELTKIEKQAIATLDDKSLSKIIKPLTNEIHLFDTFISGVLTGDNIEYIKNLKVGDKVKLIREESKFDDFNINIFDKDDNKLGYIPEKDNVIFARLMDAGKCLVAKVSNIEQKRMFPIIAIGVYLVDY